MTTKSFHPCSLMSLQNSVRRNVPRHCGFMKWLHRTAWGQRMSKTSALCLFLPGPRQLPLSLLVPLQTLAQVTILPHHECLKFHYFGSAAAAKSLQSGPTLCDPIDSSPLISPVPISHQKHLLKFRLLSPSPDSNSVGQRWGRRVWTSKKYLRRSTDDTLRNDNLFQRNYVCSINFRHSGKI